MRVWVDASTLIALDRIGEISLFRRLLRRVAVTEQVAGEVFTGKESRELRDARGDWIEVVRLRGNLARWTELGLGPGEASLFLVPSDETVILDDRTARLMAQAEGRPVVGLLGLLLAAARDGRLPTEEVRGILRRLATSGFHLSGALVAAAAEELEAPQRRDE